MPELRPLIALGALALAACAQQPATRGPIGFPPSSLTASTDTIVRGAQVAQQGGDDEESLEDKARRIFAKS